MSDGPFVQPISPDWEAGAVVAERALHDASDRMNALEAALIEVHDLIEGYVDADHNGVGFIPNNAMRAQQLINEVLKGTRR